MAEKIYMKRVLIPLWLIQIAACIILAIASALVLWVVNDAQDTGEFKKQNLDGLGTAVNALAATILTVAIFTILMDIVEIILAAIHRLKPVTNLVLQCIKLVIWTVFFILTIIAAAKANAGGLSIFLQLVLFLTSLGQVIYGAIIYRRHKNGTLYKSSTYVAEHGQAAPYPYGYDQSVPYNGGAYELQNGPVKH